MIAIDTSVLIDAIDRLDLAKGRKARTVLAQLRNQTDTVVLPWQTLAEFVRYLRRREGSGLLRRRDLTRYVGLFRSHFVIVMPRVSVLEIALDLSGRYSLSHWDSMLLRACIDAGVDTLYTEDMGSPCPFDSVRLLNHFA
jgi:predicted nucleic acid-binding protein